MTSSLSVWKSFDVPEDLLRSAKRLGKRPLDYLIEIEYVRDRKAVHCGPTVEEHDDQHINGGWSVFYVIRNDCGSFVHSKGVRKRPRQPVGTAIILDVYKPHALLCNSDPKRGAWVALVWDMKKRPTRAQANALIRTSLNR